MTNLTHETQARLQSINQFLEDIYGRRYGLNGRPRPSLAKLSDECGISRERVRQLEKDALKRLRHPARRRRLESIALETAKEILGEPGSGGCN